MSLTPLPDGRYRAQVHDPRTGKNVSVGKVLGDPSSIYPNKRIAKRKREEARALLEIAGNDGPTLQSFAYQWQTNPLYARPKESTDKQNHWAIREFVKLYGGLPINAIGDSQVSEYLNGGKRAHKVPALRTLFSDAMSREAGRLIDSNPFGGLKLGRSKGNGTKQPASEEMAWKIIHAARETAGPMFSAWLQVACFTGMRPGELDALKWLNVNFAAGTIFVAEQFNARTRTFTLPKNGLAREAILTDQARDALLRLPRDPSGFCFVAPRGGHYTPSARRAPWARTKKLAGWDKTLYLATRHHAGWYMRNVLDLDPEDVAYALGHEDHGLQVRRTYGHRDRQQGLERVRAAYASQANRPNPALEALETAV